MHRHVLCVIISIFFVMLTTICIAESVSDFKTGTIQLKNGKGIPYQLAEPKVNYTIYQYKLTPADFNIEQAEQVVDVYAQPHKPGDHWGTRDSLSMEGCAFSYYEEDGKYTLINQPYCWKRNHDKNEISIQASEKAAAILDKIGIKGYEYPFYAATSQYKVEETSMAPIHSREDYINSVRGRADIQYFEELHQYEEGRTVIAARFMLDGIPLCIDDTLPEKRKNSLEYSPGSGCTLVFNESMELIRVYIMNYAGVEKKVEDHRPIINWQDALKAAADKLPVMCEENTEMKLIEAEINYAIDNNQMTYPVWRFTFELDRRNDAAKNDPTNTADFTIGSWCVDAHTGRPCF